SGYPVAMAAQELPQRLLERLGLDVPERDVDRRESEREDAARPAAVGGFAQPRHDRLDTRRILAYRKRGEILDCSMQCARHSGAIEGDAYPLDAAVGPQAQDDDRAHAASFLGHVGQRVVLRDTES